MQSKRKIVYLAGALGAVSLAVAFGIWWSQRGVETVQTARVARQDVTSLVMASGEIKPKNYVHISANAFGKIVFISVQEGDRVRQGQELARLEAIQSEAEVRAQQAQLSAAESDVQSAEAFEQSMKANFEATVAERVRTQAQAQWKQASDLTGSFCTT